MPKKVNSVAVSGPEKRERICKDAEDVCVVGGRAQKYVQHVHLVFG